MRLLLVEDERKVAGFIARSLRENSYLVDVAETGEKALALVSRQNYDLILLDLRLPRLSGVEVCREIRGAGLETPVLMLTARTLVEQRVEGLDAGADDYLTKPFALAELYARVRALTRRGFHKGGPELHAADLELDRPRRTVKRGDQNIQPTEFCGAAVAFEGVFRRADWFWRVSPSPFRRHRCKTPGPGLSGNDKRDQCSRREIKAHPAVVARAGTNEVEQSGVRNTRKENPRLVG